MDARMSTFEYASAVEAAAQLTKDEAYSIETRRTVGGWLNALLDAYQIDDKEATLNLKARVEQVFSLNGARFTLGQ